MFARFLLLLLLSGGPRPSRASAEVDDIFASSNPAMARPRLLVATPENGAVLESSVLDIELEVHGYDVPSLLRDSKICVGLASEGKRVMETCFDQTHNMKYHADGLAPGTSYMLRVVLFDRSNAVAVSVRSFRVGAVQIDDGGTHTTIQTALQIALKRHEHGERRVAEHIYRQIILERPGHADALHLLGVALYQNGDPVSAIPYIQRAIGTNSSFDNFHNSLGECFRVLGRTQQAVSQYELALALRPGFTEAHFNLGMALQELREWDRAVAHFSVVTRAARQQRLQKAAALGEGAAGEALPQQVQVQHAQERAAPPAQAAVSLSVARQAHVRQCDLLVGLAQRGERPIEDTAACLEQALQQWPDDGHFHNEAGALYLKLGELDAAMRHYTRALEVGFGSVAHMNVALVHEISGGYEQALGGYERALAEARRQGLPDRHIAIKLAAVLPRVMPGAAALEAVRARFDQQLDALLLPHAPPSSGAERPPRDVDNSEPLNKAFSIGYHLTFHGFPLLASKVKLHRVLLQFCPSLATGDFLREDSILPSHHVAVHGGGGARPAVGGAAAAPRRRIRVGFVSRFFNGHELGRSFEGVVARLDRSRFEVVLFVIAPSGDPDEVGERVRAAADRVVDLPEKLQLCHEQLGAARLDVLVYPELGLDPVTYFLAFKRNAPVQAAWHFHPSTSGLPHVDFFLGTVHERPGAEAQYSEKLWRMLNLGVVMPRPALPPSSLAQRTRATLQAKLALPHKFHLYVACAPLTKFHPAFDEAIAAILHADRVGHLVITTSRDKAAWVQLLLTRLARQKKVIESDAMKRVHCLEVASEASMLELMQAAEVVLDTFPAGGLVPVVQALAVGTPVVTLEGALLSGRLAYALYQQMEVHECVAKDVKQYVHLALRLAHSAKFRREVSARIAAASPGLFDDARAVREWERFFEHAAAAAAATATGERERERERGGGGDFNIF
jgi:protein O-GlcNAc transferase